MRCCQIGSRWRSIHIEILVFACNQILFIFRIKILNMVQSIALEIANRYNDFLEYKKTALYISIPKSNLYNVRIVILRHNANGSMNATIITIE